MQNKSKQPRALPALEEISKGRDHINTAEFGRAIGRANQTIRSNYCLQGHYLGVRPIKLGNRLLWSVAEIKALLGGE